LKRSLFKPIIDKKSNVKYKITILISILILIFIACDKNDENISHSGPLIGSWINPIPNDTIVTFEKANSLKDNDYGFVFKPDQEFIERKNSGWCGTPPISYADFKGDWKQTDSLIYITVGYWGGTTNYQWKILSIDDHHLTIVKIFEEYH